MVYGPNDHWKDAPPFNRWESFLKFVLLPLFYHISIFICGWCCFCHNNWFIWVLEFYVWFSQFEQVTTSVYLLRKASGSWKFFFLFLYFSEFCPFPWWQHRFLFLFRFNIMNYIRIWTKSAIFIRKLLRKTYYKIRMKTVAYLMYLRFLFFRCIWSFSMYSILYFSMQTDVAFWVQDLSIQSYFRDAYSWKGQLERTRS